MEIKSIPKIEEGGEDDWAVCSDVSFFEDDLTEPCMYCQTPMFFRKEMTVMAQKMCVDCFKGRIESGEISKEDIVAGFSVETRRELSERLGREVSVGAMVDVLLASLSGPR